MIKKINEKLRSARNSLALIATIMTLGGIGGLLYMLERDGDAFSADIRALESEQINRIQADIRALDYKIEKLEESVHDKEVACETLKATIYAKQQNITYCKR